MKFLKNNLLLIRQTVPTKAPVEAETSTIINKRLFFKEFHFELGCSSVYKYYCMTNGDSSVYTSERDVARERERERERELECCVLL